MKVEELQAVLRRIDRLEQEIAVASQLRVAGDRVLEQQQRIALFNARSRLVKLKALEVGKKLPPDAFD